MGLLSAFFGLFSEKRRLQNAIDRITGDINSIDKALAKGRGDAPALLAKRSALIRERDRLRTQLAALED
jgi:DNA-binding FrmR family transcriptional regulator